MLDDERANVRGIVTEDGLFDGTISTQLEEFYIEPINRYKVANMDDDDEVHTIMYKISDVSRPGTPLCASSEMHARRKPSDLNTIAHRSKRTTAKEAPSYQWFRYVPTFRDFPSSFGSDSSSSSFSTFKETRQKLDTQPKNADNIYYDLDLTSIGNGVRKQLDEESKRAEYGVNDTAIEMDADVVHQFNSKHWRPKAGLIDTVYKYTNITKNSKGSYLPPSGVLHKSNPKILVASGNEESRANLIITNEDSLEQHARKRAIVDPKKTTCMLYLQADHLFFEKYGTEETCIEVMTRHVQRVNSIYRNTGK